MKNTGRQPFGKRLISNLEEGIRAIREDQPLRELFVETPPPPPPFDKSRLIRLRRRYGMSQAAFAQLLNVSDKAVESWEQEARRPNGAVLRLLEILELPEAAEVFSSISSPATASLGNRSRPRAMSAKSAYTPTKPSPARKADAAGKCQPAKRSKSSKS